MNIIQIILIAIVGAIMVRSVLQLYQRKIHPQDFILRLLFWIPVAAIIMYPNVTQRVADVVGISRGVDLVIYVAVLVIFYILFQMGVSIKELHEKITQLGRAIALDQAHDVTNDDESSKN